MRPEFEVIEFLRAVFSADAEPAVPITSTVHAMSAGGGRPVVGIGDDAAVVTWTDPSVVLSVDASVERVHFRREFGGLHDIGYRAFVAALSDLAAMGATPTCALAALQLPAHEPESTLHALARGMAEVAREYACPIVGGNMTSSDALSITTTVVGALQGRTALRRSHAQVGDGVYVTGALGDAAAGLALLQTAVASDHVGRAGDGTHSLPVSHDTQNLHHAVWTDDERVLVRRWFRPTARIDAGRILCDQATACIDVSDGLLQDLAHVCEASGVGAVVHASLLPVRAEFTRTAEARGWDESTTLAMIAAGGEDYELLFTARGEVAESLAARVGATRVGQVVAGGGVALLDTGHRPVDLPRQGYQHF
jgi:thiamine-monophosphate kinase